MKQLKAPKFSVDQLRSVLDYDAETGVFVWRVKPNGRVPFGAHAGTLMADGYRRIKLFRDAHRAHRLAWFHHYGEWPMAAIDHINGRPSDNRIANLRLVSGGINAQNLKRPCKNNRSGYLGVSLNSSSTWTACIRVDGRSKHLGNFSTPEQAHAAYLSAKRELHPGCTL